MLACLLGLVGCAADGGGGHEGDVAGIPTFDEFLGSLPRSPTGGYVIEEDMPYYDLDELRDYYEQTIASQALLMDSLSATVDNKHTAAQARALTYCVSDEFKTFFGTDYKAAVVSAMSTATAAWESAAGTNAGVSVVDYQYLSAHDANCTSANTVPFFYVRPFADAAQAQGFRPNYSRSNRVLWIGRGGILPSAPVTFAGILRHELGHTLGFRHEHARISGNPCMESTTFRAITPYNQVSVMHYPGVTSSSSYPCGSNESRDDTLTAYDRAGVRCIYNPSPDACKGIRISTAAPQFTADNSGTVYRLNTGSTSIDQYRIPTSGALPTWQPLVTVPTTSAIRAGGSRLYRINQADSKLFRWSGSTWTDLGPSGSSLVVAYTGGHAYRLDSNGTIWRLPSSTTGTTWTQILTTTAAGRSIFAGTTNVFRRDSNGSLHQWISGTTWTQLATGITSVAQDRQGVIYSLDSAGIVRRYDTSVSPAVWRQIGSGMTSIRGGLDTVYATPSSSSTTIMRYRTGTSWHDFARNVSVFFGGGPRKLARLSGAGGTVAGELHDYLYPSPG